MNGRPVVNDWATDWDFNSRQYHDDAPSVWRELRQSRSLAHTNRYGGAWATIRYEDVYAAAQDPSTFSSRHHFLMDDPQIERLEQPPINLDPPAHGAFRRILLPHFGPLAVAALRPLTERTCEDLLDRLAGRAQVDASADYARHIPVAVTAAMLDVPQSDADLFRGWVHDIIERPDDVESMVRSTRECLAYFRAQLAVRREQPGEDIISVLACSELDGVPLPDRTIAAAAFVVLLAGIDTVWTTLGAAILHLARSPGDLHRLQHEPNLMDNAIEEVLRLYAPAELARLVTRDTELAGTPIKAGDYVLLSYPAANRDPDAFPDPDTFVIDRAHNRHLAFGVGIHRCIGSNLARMQLQVALTAWIRRIPQFTVDPSRPVQMTEGGVIRGPRTVPLAIG